MNQSLSIENQIIEPLQQMYLSPIQRAIVKYLSWTPSAMSALKKRFPERNAHVLKQDIQYMMRVGVIERIGLIYSIVQPVEAQPVDNQIDRMTSILKEYDIDDIDLPKAETVIIELTELENKVLTCFINLLEDYDWGFSDIICSNLVKPTHLTLNQIKGVIGSLTKKGLVYTDDMDTKHDLIHLNEKAYQLHKQWNDPTKGNLEIRIIPKGKTQDIESQAVSPLNASNEKQDMIRTALKNTLLNSGKPTTEISKKGNISKTEISSFKNGTRNISLDRCLELTCKLGLTTYFLNHLQRGINDRLTEINGTKFKTTKTQLNLF